VKLLAVSLALGLSVGLLAACSGGAAAHPGQASVSAKHGGSVALDGARLWVPPGAISGQGYLTASTGGARPSLARLTGTGAPALMAVTAAPVHFVLTGARVFKPVRITFRVGQIQLPSAVPAASWASAVWLAYYDTQTQRWQPVPSTYDAAARTVTAQVRHLSWWAPWTWDWQQIALRLRQSLSALGSGRAAPSPCSGLHGVTVTSSGGQDPPLVGCAAQNGANALTVSLTGNRSYAMVVHAPAGASLEPPSYSGFDEWIETRDATTNALGGPYLAVTHTLSYDLPLNGGPVTFTAAASWKTQMVDQAAPAAEAVFDLVTLGYANCILDSAARSEPASFADAPGLIVECFPGLAEATTVGRFYLKYLDPISHYVKSLLESYDRAHDASLGLSGKVYIVRPAAVIQLPKCPKAAPGVPAGLVQAVAQQQGNLCEFEIENLKYDSQDPSWVLFLISPLPGIIAQGAGAIAHEVNGNWTVVASGSAPDWCSAGVPAEVVAYFGLGCP
jgi:hypothetical protein